MAHAGLLYPDLMFGVSVGEAEEPAMGVVDDEVDADAGVNDPSAEYENVELEVGCDHGIEEVNRSGPRSATLEASGNGAPERAEVPGSDVGVEVDV